jgi:hypothetical protein
MLMPDYDGKEPQIQQVFSVEALRGDEIDDISRKLFGIRSMFNSQMVDSQSWDATNSFTGLRIDHWELNIDQIPFHTFVSLLHNLAC